MFRKVLEDYKDGFRWSRLKEVYHFGILWNYIYIFVFFPIMVNLNDKMERMIGYYAVMIPVLFGIHSMSVIPIRLPKQMFLCPLTEGDRKQYVKLLSMVRLAVPILLGMVTYSISVAFGWLETELLCVQMFYLFSFMLCGTLTLWKGGNYTKNGRQKAYFKNPKLKNLPTISTIGMLSAAIFLIVSPMGLYEDTLFWIMVIVFGITAIVCDVLVLRYFTPVIELTIDYEASYLNKT